VVEDEVLIRCDVAEHLREAGYTVVETASGEDAIAMCKSDMSIDIVFTDIHLIGSASGWDVAECVRADRGAPPLNQSWRITCDRVDRELLLGTVEKPSAISAVIDFRLIFDTSWPTVRYFFRLIKLGHGGSPPTP